MDRNMTKVQEILNFWFGDIKDDWPKTDRNPMWWFGGQEVDRQIIERFSELVQQAKRKELDGWKHTAQGRLALIILLDQFSRNIFRKTPQAFESDEYALSLSREGIAAGLDKDLSFIERVFFYMPFMHSERLVDHDDSIGLYRQIINEAKVEHHEQAQRYFGAAKMHQELIVQFGRYPHRNAILFRTSTEQEIEYLRDAEKFGQG